MQENRQLMTATLSEVTGIALDADLVSGRHHPGGGDWSIDTIAGLGAPGGDLEISLPRSATINRARLYITLHRSHSSPTLIFDGQRYGAEHFELTGNSCDNDTLTWCADVTEQIASSASRGDRALSVGLFPTFITKEQEGKFWQLHLATHMVVDALPAASHNQPIYLPETVLDSGRFALSPA
ncbi:MAG: hypothetical protein GXP10_10990 [Gammaproteobacteria bacterium]|nr:hypothetical protein [Gammaproteobacteria bacterium]